MNERIKDLAVKAGAWEYYEINEGVDGDEKPLEKFAELLILRCANVAWMHAPETDELSYSRFISDKIKEYFGVEE